MHEDIVLNHFTLQKFKVRDNFQAPYHDLILQKDSIPLAGMMR